MQPEPPEFERDAMIIRADTSDITKPLVMYPDDPNILVTYHNPAGLFASPNMTAEFRYTWPEAPVKLQRKSPPATEPEPAS